MKIEYKSATPSTGDAGSPNCEAVYVDGQYVGRIRTLTGTSAGEYHATTQRKGRPVGRYYASKSAAAKWLARQFTR